MRKHIFLLLVLLTSVTFAQKVEKQLGDFTSLKTFDIISVKLIPSNENRAVVTGDHAKDVQFINKDGMLKIRLQIERSYQGEETYVALYYKKLHVIDANEGSYITSDSPISQIDLDVKAQEGAGISLPVDVKKLEVRSVSGSEVEITGTAKNQTVVVNSGGKYKGKQLNTEQTVVNVSAGGMAKIKASELVEAKVRAGGNIKIYGNPKVVEKKTVLGGNITEVN